MDDHRDWIEHHLRHALPTTTQGEVGVKAVGLARQRSVLIVVCPITENLAKIVIAQARTGEGDLDKLCALTLAAVGR